MEKMTDKENNERKLGDERIWRMEDEGVEIENYRAKRKKRKSVGGRRRKRRRKKEKGKKKK